MRTNFTKAYEGRCRGGHDGNQTNANFNTSLTTRDAGIKMGFENKVGLNKTKIGSTIRLRQGIAQEDGWYADIVMTPRRNLRCMTY